MNIEKSKSVNIPVKIIDSKIIYLYDNKLPNIKNLTEGELIIPEDSLEDSYMINELQKERKQKILECSQKLLISVRNSDKEVKELLSGKYIKGLIELTTGKFIYISLEEKLYLNMRGTKKSSLSNVKCTFEISGEKVEASSINNAYTMISERLETKRKSHTGDVFELCYYYNKLKKTWDKLNVLRLVWEDYYKEEMRFNNRSFTVGSKYVPDLSGERLKILEYILQYGEIAGREIKLIPKYSTQEYYEIIREMINESIIKEQF